METGAKSEKTLLITKEWCEMIIHFMLSKAGPNNSLKEVLNLVKGIYHKKNLAGLKSIKKDLGEWVKVLSRPDLFELNILLQNKFGENLDNDANKIIRVIEKIISRGKIINDEEYELIVKRVEEIYENENNKLEIETLNILLVNYLNGQSVKKNK